MGNRAQQRLCAGPSDSRRLLAALGAASATVSQAQAVRDYISIVGSSTVYPFATVVAETVRPRYGKFKTPKIEPTGSGGGLKLFCDGVGVQHPDIANSSRRITASEVATCAENGVDGNRRGQDRLRRHRARECEGRAALSTYSARHLPRAREERARSRRRQQARAESVHDVVARSTPTLPADEDRGARSAADVRHARRVPRARDGGRLQNVPWDRGAAARRRISPRATRCATTAATSRPARTTT